MQNLVNIIPINSNHLTTIYGPAASGKTTLALQLAFAVARYGGKVAFFDTSDSFSIERFQQIAGENFKRYLENIFIIKLASFNEQNSKINSLVDMSGNFDIIIFDNIATFYRKEYSTDIYSINKAMEIQVRILKEISRTKPVVLINQIHSNIKLNREDMIFKDSIENLSDKVFCLKKDHSKIIETKSGNEFNYRIENKGITIF